MIAAKSSCSDLRQRGSTMSSREGQPLKASGFSLQPDTLRGVDQRLRQRATSGPAGQPPPHRSRAAIGRDRQHAVPDQAKRLPELGQHQSPAASSIGSEQRGRWSRFRTSRRSSSRSAARPGVQRPATYQTRCRGAGPVHLSGVTRLPPSLAGTLADRDHVEAVIRPSDSSRCHRR